MRYLAIELHNSLICVGSKSTIQKLSRISIAQVLSMIGKNLQMSWIVGCVLRKTPVSGLVMDVNPSLSFGPAQIFGDQNSTIKIYASVL